MILVDLSEDSDNRVTLSVTDRGVGLPDGLNPSKAKTLGLSIIEILTQQLGGVFSSKSINGAHFSVAFMREVKSTKVAPAA